MYGPDLSALGGRARLDPPTGYPIDLTSLQCPLLAGKRPSVNGRISTQGEHSGAINQQFFYAVFLARISSELLARLR